LKEVVMAFDEPLAGRIRDALARKKGVEDKKMFGGVGFLGFAVDWEHRFEENTPAYLQVSKAGLVLHLSEHHGDACHGSTVFVWMTGIEEFHWEEL
jgi:Glyoxalase superfamily protein